MKSKITAIYLSVLLNSIVLITNTAGAPTWNPTGSMSVVRRYQTATRLANGTVLAAGGNNSTGVLSSSELYNPATGTWSATGAMTTPRVSHMAALLSNGKVLVVGGETTGGNMLSTAELYDPATGTWSATGAMSTVRVAHTVTVLPNGKVLVAGGANTLPGPAGILASAELYDPTTGTWSATSSMPHVHHAHTATRLANGKVLVAGGSDRVTINNVTSADLYDPTSGTWTSTGSLSTGRAYHTATLLPNGKVLVAAGINGGSVGGTILSSTELYDPLAGTWTSSGSLSITRYYHDATLLTTGQVLVTGGEISYGIQTASAELYDASGLWSTTASMLNPRSNAPLTLLADGRVLVEGGLTSTTSYSSAEIFSSGVADTTAPVITSAIPSPSNLWPANHKMVTITVTVQATDNVDPSPTNRIVQVSCNEPFNAAVDVTITGALTLQLRAERSGAGIGRIYTITIESRDASGNVALRDVYVTVPHNQ